jgi:enoyl-CoA hydratase/carnithine racemase
MGHVSVVEREGVAVLTVDRPPANAMDLALLGDVVEAVERLAADVPAAVVLAGRQGFFSAGADLKAVPGYGPAEQRAMVEAINRMALGAYGLPCPVVCAITGHAIAGGMVLALCGDHRVASTEGRYGLTEVKVGVPYPQAAIGVVRAELPAPRPRGAWRWATTSSTRRSACASEPSTRRSRRGPCSTARWWSRGSWPPCRPTSTRARRVTCGAPRSRRCVSAPSAIRSWTHG